MRSTERSFSGGSQEWVWSEVPIAPRSPWQNAYAERFVGSLRRECLDHVIAVNERQVYRIVSNYARYYNRARTHLALAKDAPEPRSVQPRANGRVVASQRWADSTIDTSGWQLEW